MGFRKKHGQPAKPLVRSFEETRNPAPADLDVSLRWFLICARPRAEAKAKEGLEAAGSIVFWPSLHRIICNGRRRIEHDVATFPGYLFASGGLLGPRSDDDEEEAAGPVVAANGRLISSVRDIDGIVKVYGNERGWLRVPGQAIRAVANHQNQAAPEIPPARFAAGTVVNVLSGPFMHLQAVMVEQIGQHEARVMVEFLGGERLVSLGISQLDAA